MEPQFTEFLYRDSVIWIAAFILGGFVFALGPIAIVYLFMPLGTRNIRNKTLQPIECGMDPIGDSWIRYGVVFYLYALIFLAFDVDVLFLFPVALAYNDPDVRLPRLCRNPSFRRNSVIGRHLCLDQGSI